jgi:CheY-like chemotaxis protein
MKVLLVDDHDASLRIGRRILERLRCQVLLAADGEQALALCGSNSPDLVLMDGSMPGMGGAEAIAAIRELPGDRGQVPIIGTTSSDQLAVQCARAGANGFIRKPFSPENLKDVLDRVRAGQYRSLTLEAGKPIGEPVNPRSLQRPRATRPRADRG